MTDPTQLPPRLTSRETAELLRLSLRGLAYRRRHKLAPLPIGGTPRRPLYDRDEVLGLGKGTP
jgi:hypothetical protein